MSRWLLRNRVLQVTAVRAPAGWRPSQSCKPPLSKRSFSQSERCANAVPGRARLVRSTLFAIQDAGAGCASRPSPTGPAVSSRRRANGEPAIIRPSNGCREVETRQNEARKADSVTAEQTTAREGG